MFIPSRRQREFSLWVCLALVCTGCSSVARNAIPAACLHEPNILDKPRGEKHPIDFTRLRQDPPAVYLLGPDDILGLYVEGVLGKADEPPPVYYPQYRPDKPEPPPALGFPIPVREDGTIALPLVEPIQVAGLTVAQAEDEIRKTYTEVHKILVPGRDRIIVTLIKKRTFNVIVVREDTSTQQNYYSGLMSRERGGMFEAQKVGMTKSLELPAYENDILHALAESGGLPGVDTKNEIKILRGAFKNARERDQYLKTLQDPIARNEVIATGRKIQRIPLRASPGERPVNLSQEDIILNKGDIVFIESRDEEVFYTGGMIKGGQFPVPRDYDLDVLGAIAMSGGSISASAGGGGPGVSGSRGSAA
jgi:protein involved in polysaccharide export with SLBB domain